MTAFESLALIFASGILVGLILAGAAVLTPTQPGQESESEPDRED